jgi:hypothetical protein
LRLVIEGSVTGLFEELADVVGQSAADDSPVLLLVAFLILRKLRIKDQTADAA